MATEEEQTPLPNALRRITVENYKSLRELTFEPSDLTVLIGPNAAGKSNLAELLDFVSEIYRHGLEVAIARKGGYENIAHRKASRSKSGINIHITADFTPDSRFGLMQPGRANPTLQIEHQFAFAAKGASIAAEFEIENELLIVSARIDNAWKDILTLVRDRGIRVNDQNMKRLFPGRHDRDMRYMIGLPDVDWMEHATHVLPPTELHSVQMIRFMPMLRGLTQALSAIRVFQISPNRAREFGIPTPTPQLERTGANLPAVVDALQKKNVLTWQKILRSMRNVLPALDEIKVSYTTSRTLGLFFIERNVGRPWTVDEVSDGTLQALSLLVAIYDPGTTMLVIEEPENSVHPWIIRTILRACTEASTEKQVLITTHSPVVIDHTRPEQLWIIWRSDGESHARRLTDIDRSFLKQWEAGDIATFEYLDTGAVKQAVPPAFQPHHPR